MAIVTGASSGLGLLVADELYEQGFKVIGVGLKFEYERPYIQREVDLSDPKAIAMFALTSGDWGRLDVLVNCAGINQIGYIEDFKYRQWDEVLDVNLRAPFLMTQAFLDDLKRAKGTVCNIVSNASHMPMTASAAYNASKGGLHILTLQLARELTKRYGITVFGVSPNKMKGTGMSRDIENQVCEVRGWTPEAAEQYQKAALLTGEETPPECVAEFICYLLSNKQRHKFLSGCILPYGA